MKASADWLYVDRYRFTLAFALFLFSFFYIIYFVYPVYEFHFK